jgi:hypothetical protein
MEGELDTVIRPQLLMIDGNVRGLNESGSVSRMSVVDSKRSDVVNNSSLLLSIDPLVRNDARLALARVSRSAREKSVNVGVEICASLVV